MLKGRQGQSLVMSKERKGQPLVILKGRQGQPLVIPKGRQGLSPPSTSSSSATFSSRNERGLPRGRRHGISSATARDRSMRIRKDTPEYQPNHPEADVAKLVLLLLLESSPSGVSFRILINRSLLGAIWQCGSSTDRFFLYGGCPFTDRTHT